MVVSLPLSLSLYIFIYMWLSLSLSLLGCVYVCAYKEYMCMYVNTRNTHTNKRCEYKEYTLPTITYVVLLLLLKLYRLRKININYEK